MHRTNSPGLRTERHLRALVRQAQARGNPILPSLSELVRRLSVSRGTVLKVIRRLRLEGLIVSVPRRGYAVAGQASSAYLACEPAPRPQAPPPPSPRWRSLAETLKRDMLECRFPAGSDLPSVKELCALYGSGNRSVGAALRRLCEEGRLERRGPRYRVVGAMPARRSLTIVFVRQQMHQGMFAPSFPYEAELWRNLEWECDRRQLELRVRFYQHGALAPSGDESNTAGFILSTLGPDLAARDRGLRDALSTHLPVALLDENGEGAVLTRRHRSPLLRSFSLGTSRTHGRRVGEYLLSRGHRRAVFFAQLDDERARKRWEGVREPYVESGLGDAVAFRPIGVPYWEHTDEDPRFASLHSVVNTAGRRLARDIGVPWQEREVERPLRHHAMMLLIRKHAWALFEHMLENEPATAWVGFNDELALLALEFLRGKDTPIARRVYLVGFDDTPGAFRQGLSSYGFNIAAVVNAMLNHLLAPKRAGPRSCVVEFPGRLLERRPSGSDPA